MQGDIFQLEFLATQVSKPKPQPEPVARSAKPASDSAEIAIYNEDDLSHLLYVNNNHPHHHHHHSHHASHKRETFTHPADAGTVLINPVVEYGTSGSVTPALSDCESFWSGSEGEGEVESPLTAPLPILEEDAHMASLDAYRHKGRRNAMSVAFEDGFEFPVFLGRQSEEWPAMPRTLPRETPVRVQPALVPAPAVNKVVLPETHHVDATSGPAMSWWPEPLETSESDWTREEMEWVLQLEKEKLATREQKGDILGNIEGTENKKEKEKNYEREYGVTHVGNVEGPLMSWWPAPFDNLDYEWSERFYE
jgi:hypothetical protein